MFWAGLSTDLIFEQVLMRRLKTWRTDKRKGDDREKVKVFGVGLVHAC